MVNMLGIFLVVCNTSYYMCPCCTKIVVWRGDGMDLLPQMCSMAADEQARIRVSGYCAEVFFAPKLRIESANYLTLSIQDQCQCRKSVVVRTSGAPASSRQNTHTTTTTMRCMVCNVCYPELAPNLFCHPVR